MDMATTTDQDDPALAELRLRQLTSAAVPVGAFAYSHGLESAVELGWVSNADQAREWLGGVLRQVVAGVEVPLLARLMAACAHGDDDAARRWSALLLALRDTAELRAQERALADAWCALLGTLGVPGAAAWADAPQRTALALYALGVAHYGVGVPAAARALLWSWLEGQVSAAVRAVQLGHGAGQRVLYALAGQIPAAAACGLALADEEIGGGAPALGIASCRHETQYSRLFRS